MVIFHIQQVSVFVAWCSPSFTSRLTTGTSPFLEFHELPISILRKAFETLVKRGRAQIIEGKDEIGEGVRFL